MARYDLEDLVDDVETLLKAKLNAQISAIEAEKVAVGKVATALAAVDDSAYFKLAWNDQALNKNPALGIFVAEHSEESQGADMVLNRYTIEIGIILSGTQNDALATKKLLRYVRALRQTFEQNHTRISGFVKESLKSIGPVDFTANVDSAEEYKIAGVSLQIVVG